MYGFVPPLAETLAVPSVLPQVASVNEVVAPRAGGSVRVNVSVVKQLFASLTSTVYVFAERLELLEPVPPAGNQVYV